MYDCGKKEIEAIKKVLLKKNFYRHKKDKGECELFEEEFSKFLGVKHSIFLTSGTNALVLALKNLNLKPDDEVIVPSFTFYATPASVILAGGTPIIADIDSSLTLSLADIEKKINLQTKAIIAVSMDGIICDMERLKNLAEKYNLYLIEDCAQCLGGKFKNKFLGTWGHFGCFSLNEDKIISSGEGGILVTSDEHFYKKSFGLHDGGGQFNPYKKLLLEDLGPFIGLSMRMSNLNAALARVQLTRLNGLLKKLKKRKEIFVSILSDVVEIPHGHSKSGDIGTSLHFKFSTPTIALNMAKIFLENKIPIYPISLKPAHCFWQWIPQLNSHFEGKNKYKKIDYLTSIDILSSTLRYSIDPKVSIWETQKLAEKIKNLIQSCR